MAEDVPIAEHNCVTVVLTPSFVSAVCESGNGGSKDKLQELFDTISKVDREQKNESKSEMCTVEGCTKEHDDNILRCDKCKEFSHFECTGLPAYLLYLFSSKCHKRYRCKKCVGVVPEFFHGYNKEIVVGIGNNGNIENDPDMIDQLKSDLERKCVVIKTIEAAQETLQELLTSKDEMIESQKTAIDGMSTVDLHERIAIKDSKLQEFQVEIGSLKKVISEDNCKLKELTNTLQSEKGMSLGISKERDDALEIISVKELELMQCKEEIEVLKSSSSNNESGAEELTHNIESLRRRNQDLARRLEDQTLIASKTELAFNTKTELVNAKNDIIENQKIIIEELQKERYCCRKEDNMTSNTSELIEVSGNGVQHQSTVRIEIPQIPGLQESMLCLSNIALHGVIVNGLLLWADIKRRTTPAEIWKAEALQHFTEEEITDAKAILWEVCEVSVIGRMIKRQGTSKVVSEIGDIITALTVLAENEVLPVFVASSNMVMQNPSDKSGSTCNNVQNLDDVLDRVFKTQNDLIIKNHDRIISTADHGNKKIDELSKRLDTILQNSNGISHTINATTENPVPDTIENIGNNELQPDAVRSLGNVMASPQGLHNTMSIWPPLEQNACEMNKPTRHTMPGSDNIRPVITNANPSWAQTQHSSGWSGQQHENGINGAISIEDNGLVGNNRLPGNSDEVPWSVVVGKNRPIQSLSPLTNPTNGAARRQNWRNSLNILHGTAKNGDDVLSSDIDLVAYGLAKNVTALQLSRYLQEKGLNIVDCVLLTKYEGARALSFRITIKAMDFERAQDPNIWPYRVGIRMYKQFNSTKTQRNIQYGINRFGDRKNQLNTSRKRISFADDTLVSSV